MDLEGAERGLLLGETRAVAKALRAVDDQVPGSRALLSRLFARSRERRELAQVVGLTGSPGAGKSTVADALIARYRAAGKRVGVIAVDPSSPFSGGAILGDRIRMRQHTLDEGVFIRSLATRGALGGLSRSASDSVQILISAGFDVVLLETVGVGQDEIDVCRVADSVVVIGAPGMGDDIQAIKAGILEIADIYLVNKADREGADKMVSNLRAMLGLVPHPEGAWVPPVLEAVAIEQKGIDALVLAIAEHRRFMRETARGRERERERREQAFLQMFGDALLSASHAKLGVQLGEAAAAVARGEDPYARVEALVAQVVAR